MTAHDYRSLLARVCENNPALFNCPVKLTEELNQFDHLIEAEDDKIAKCILVQGRNLIAVALNKPLIDEIEL